jgi:hypothetical protein
MCNELLHGVYPERSEWAQHHNVSSNRQIITDVPAHNRHSKIQINVYICMLQVMQLMQMLQLVLANSSFPYFNKRIRAQFDKLS